MVNSTSEKKTRAPQSRARRSTAPPSKGMLYSDMAVRIAMLGVSLGSLAQLMGYSDLGHLLLAVGGACGVPNHIGSK